MAPVTAPAITGSSPRARGALRPGLPQRLGQGIIPACAGSTYGISPILSPVWDHPRVRGEHRGASRSGPSWKGSSPRARGARHAPTRQGRPGGIIPACAGSTMRSTRPARMSRDHPRVRGEHYMLVDQAEGKPGSSPRARGAPTRRRRRRVGGGIIPACAGSTGRSPGQAVPPRDHPRVRGEHSLVRASPDTERGSSPRARGARVPERAALLVDGIIPACAGSTPFSRGPRPKARDHPRVRGEHIRVTG